MAKTVVRENESLDDALRVSRDKFQELVPLLKLVKENSMLSLV